MKKYTDFWHVVIGSGPVGTFLGYVVVAYICATVFVMAGLVKRDVASTYTPVKFSLKFFLIDNLIRLLSNFLFIPIFIRLLYETVTGPFMLMLAVGIGFGADGLAQLAKKYGLYSMNKITEKIMPGIKEKDPIVIPKPNSNN